MTITHRISCQTHWFGHKPTTDRDHAAAPSAPAIPVVSSLDRTPSVTIVPIGLLNGDTRRALGTAASMNTDEILAIHVRTPYSRSEEREFERKWEEWNTGLTMVFLDGAGGDLSHPIVDYVRRQYAAKRVFLVVSPAMPLRCELNDMTTYNYATHLISLLRDEQNVTICRPAGMQS